MCAIWDKINHRFFFVVFFIVFFSQAGSYAGKLSYKFEYTLKNGVSQNPLDEIPDVIIKVCEHMIIFENKLF